MKELRKTDKNKGKEERVEEGDRPSEGLEKRASLEQDGHTHAQVTRMLGNGSIDALCIV